MIRTTAAAVAAGCLLSTAFVQAAAEPTLGGAAGMDMTCVPMPGSPAGHFVCEDPVSYARCKSLEDKGSVRIDGDDKKTPVVQCQQGG